MAILKSISIVVYVAILAVATGCKKQAEDKPGDKEAAATSGNKTTEAPEAPAPTPAKPAGNVDAVVAVMVPYEACRKKLVANDASLKMCAEQIASAAGKLEGGVAVPGRAITAAAKALANAPNDDISALRLAFGEISRPVESMLIATPGAATKYKMYDCSLAKGFTRWAQPIGAHVAMANPYGPKLLECGVEVHDHHAGPAGHGAKGD